MNRNIRFSRGQRPEGIITRRMRAIARSLRNGNLKQKHRSQRHQRPQNNYPKFL